MDKLYGFSTLFACLTTFCLIAVGDTARAQELITDRPDFTESAVTVPVGMLQIEGGATHTSLGGDHSELVLGEALLRWGFRDKLEFRFGPPSIVSASNGDTDTGISDGSIGAKLQLGPVGSGWDLAVIATTTVPIGDDQFSSDEFDPSLIFTAGRAIDETFSVGGQIVAALPTVGSDRELEWGLTWVIGAALAPQTGGFVELAATIPEEGTSAVVGHTGIVHQVTDRLQIDIHGGIGLSDTAPDAFIGAGVSALLP